MLNPVTVYVSCRKYPSHRTCRHAQAVQKPSDAERDADAAVQPQAPGPKRQLARSNTHASSGRGDPWPSEGRESVWSVYNH
jgi:hypothetical protein